MKKLFTTLLCATALCGGAWAQYNIDWAKTRDLTRTVSYVKYNNTYIVRDKVEATAITPLGAVYNAGQATEDFDFANGIVGVLNGGSSYVLKYNADGTEAWSTEIYGPSYITQVVATEDEGVIVAGRFAAEIDIKGTNGVKQTFTKTEYTDKHPFAFIARYDKDGVIKWAKAFETTFLVGEDTPVFAIKQVKVAGDKLLFTGYFDGKVTFNGTEYSSTSFEEWGATYTNYSAFGIVASLESGEVEKFLPVIGDQGGNNLAQGSTIDADNSGNIVVTTYVKGNATVPNTDITISSPVNETGYLSATTIFIAKYNAAGEIQWNKKFSSKINTASYLQNIFTVSDMEFNADQKIVLVGNYSGSLSLTDNVTLTSLGDDNQKADNFVMILSENNGDLEKAISFGSVENESKPQLAVSENRLFVAGEYSESMEFNGRTLTSQGGSDVFIASFENNGTPLIASSMGSTEADYFTSISALNNKTIALSGIYKGTFSVEDTELTSNGDTYDAFVVKMQNNSDFPTNTPDQPNVVQKKSMFYPNPATQNIQVKNTDKIEIYSISGMLIYSKSNPTTVDVSNLKAGMYLVNLYKSDNITSMKLIKK